LCQTSSDKYIIPRSSLFPHDEQRESLEKVDQEQKSILERLGNNEA
jgi:hypothetical protein